VPRIESAEDAVLHPGLAILSALAHHDAQDVSMHQRVLEGIKTARLEQSDRTYYSDLIWATLSTAAHRALEARMFSIPKDYVPVSPLGKYMQRGYDEALARGRAESLRIALMTVMKQRHLSLTSAQTAVVEGCQDLDQMTAWVGRAAVAASPDEIFSTKVE
jgi:hypothetical protein